MISTRRAVLAITSFLILPASSVWLVAHGRPGPAAIALVLLLAHFIVELVAFEVRDHAAARLHREAEHAGAGPLSGYCPQVDDRYFEQIEARRWTA